MDDEIAEGTESLTVGGTAGLLTVTPAALELTDNDLASTAVTLSVEPGAVDEGAGPTTVTVTAQLDGSARTAPTSVNIAVTGDTATPVDDFATVNPFTVTIEAGSTSGTGTFTLTPVDDAVAEGPEHLTVGGTASPLTVTPVAVELTDNDAPSTAVTLSVNPETVGEGAGPTPVTVTATLDESAGTSDTRVTVMVLGDEATPGDDFATVRPFTVTIAAGATTGTATFTLRTAGRLDSRGEREPDDWRNCRERPDGEFNPAGSD